MDAVVYNVRFIRTILFVFFALSIVSCSNIGNKRTNANNICLGGTNCKAFSTGVISKRRISNNLPIFDSNSLSIITADVDLQDVTMYNLHCKKCTQNVKNKSNQQTMNMYLMKITEEKNGLPLNNIELNAVLREYNGSQVNGFCNHTMSIVNPVLKFLSKQRFIIKDSIKRHKKIVM